MTHGDDFIVTVHALDRFEERFQLEYEKADDIGQLIYEETMDAFENNRVANVPPVEFAVNDLDRWGAGKSQVAWTPNKTRGYVLVEGNDGMTVATVLVGRPSDEARQRLYGTSKRSRPLHERDGHGYRVNPTADPASGVEETSAAHDA